MNPMLEHITKLPMNKIPALKVPPSILPYILTAILSGVSTYGLIQYRVTALEKTAEKQDIRQTLTENTVNEIKTGVVGIQTDMKWVRDALVELKRRPR